MCVQTTGCRAQKIYAQYVLNNCRSLWSVGCCLQCCCCKGGNPCRAHRLHLVIFICTSGSATGLWTTCTSLSMAGMNWLDGLAAICLLSMNNVVCICCLHGKQGNVHERERQRHIYTHPLVLNKGGNFCDPMDCAERQTWTWNDGVQTADLQQHMQRESKCGTPKCGVEKRNVKGDRRTRPAGAHADFVYMGNLC